SECFSFLTRGKLPRLALNNGLYRGELPDELKDITWVEEMACSLYRTTAHVSRLYGSTSEENPLYIHGNTCAHPMQVISHAKKLPRTPSDVNDLITVVFVGSRKLRKDELSKLSAYMVRKSKILSLLK
ncbi:hypothetical protein BDP27DRAFT_1146750, partial [Rhodocollybia butyracea]